MTEKEKEDQKEKEKREDFLREYQLQLLMNDGCAGQTMMFVLIGIVLLIVSCSF